MADMNRFSERLIDIAERFADVVDAAEGKGARKSGPGARWLILPAAGAAAYALATSSSSVARQTRGFIQKAKDRATDLPDADLFDRVKEVTGFEEESSSGSGTQTPSSRTQRSRARQSRAGGTKRARRGARPRRPGKADIQSIRR
jgi:hypothetical protein